MYILKERKRKMTDINLENICKAAVSAKKKVENLNTNEKNNALFTVAEALMKNASYIVEAKKMD